MRNIEGGATHARTTNKQTNREPRRRWQLPTYLPTYLPKTLGYDASGTMPACIGIRHAFTGDRYLQRFETRLLGATADVGSQGRVCIGQDQG
jgi:hypothetical protein